jgi:hypothetical protein
VDIKEIYSKNGSFMNRFIVFCGLVWFGLVWFGLVWFGLVWFGLVWFGLVKVNDKIISFKEF